MRLTNVQARGAAPRDRSYRLFDAGGLYMEVAPSGGKWWRLKYRWGGKEKRISLGTYPTVSLKEPLSSSKTLGLRNSSRMPGVWLKLQPTSQSVQPKKLVRSTTSRGPAEVTSCRGDRAARAGSPLTWIFDAVTTVLPISDLVPATNVPVSCTSVRGDGELRPESNALARTRGLL